MERAKNEEAFDLNWSHRLEAEYLHWSSKEPSNQIQLAFLNHWLTFSRFLPAVPGKVLEVGCGRGSLSAYFAQNFWDCTLLDISQIAIHKAQHAFQRLNLGSPHFVCADCRSLPFDDNSFDVIFSIGLLEHLQDDELKVAMREQCRSLAVGGTLFAYIVPRKKVSVQEQYRFVNSLLASEYLSNGDVQNLKEPVYRANHSLAFYEQLIAECGLKIILSSGTYAMPMISHSCEFPFTLLGPASENLVVDHLRQHLASRYAQGFDDPWLCDEGYGHALLVVACKDG